MAPGRPLNEFGGKQTEPGGGFKYFLFLPQTLGKIRILTSIFFKGVETTNQRKIGSLPICVFLNSFLEDIQDRQKTLKRGTDSQLLNLHSQRRIP